MVEKTVFYAVRHGESVANASGIVSDKGIDHALTALGLEQAKETALSLRS